MSDYLECQHHCQSLNPGGKLVKELSSHFTLNCMAPTMIISQDLLRQELRHRKRYSDVCGKCDITLTPLHTCYKSQKLLGANDCRLITNHHPSAKLLTLLVYVLFTRSAPCMSNHMLQISRFALKSEEWAAGITLLSWVRRRRPRWCRCHHKSSRSTCCEKNDLERGATDPGFITIPTYYEPLITAQRYGQRKSTSAAKIDVEQGVTDEGHRGKHQGVDGSDIGWDTMIDYRFELQASSLMLATNEFGDFSKCCIVSECLNAQKLEDVGHEIRRLRHRFVHQPQTGRWLVFLLLLGRLSQYIVEQYQYAMYAVSYTLTNDVSPILDL